MHARGVISVSHEVFVVGSSHDFDCPILIDYSWLRFGRNWEPILMSWSIFGGGSKLSDEFRSCGCLSVLWGSFGFGN